MNELAIFLAIATLVGAILYAVSNGQADGKGLDTLKEKQLWKAAVFGLGAVIVFPLLATIFVFLTSVLFKSALEPIITFGWACSAVFFTFFTISWAFNEFTAHGSKLEVEVIADHILQVEASAVLLFLRTQPEGRHSIADLYVMFGDPAGAASTALSAAVKRFTGDDNDLLGNHRITELVRNIGPSKQKFAQRFVAEAAKRRVTVFEGREGGEALSPSKLTDWPNQLRYVQYGDHRPKSFFARWIS